MFMRMTLDKHYESRGGHSLSNQVMVYRPWSERFEISLLASTSKSQSISGCIQSMINAKENA